MTLADRPTWDALVADAIAKRFPAGHRSPLIKAALDNAYAAKETTTAAPFHVAAALAKATRETVERILSGAGLAGATSDRTGYRIADVARDDGSIVVSHFEPNRMRAPAAAVPAIASYTAALTEAGIRVRPATFPDMLVVGPVRRAAKKLRRREAATT